MEFAKVLEQVAAFLEGRGYRFAVVGAVALHAYGSTRATGDLDFAAEESARADLLAFLDSLGYERLHASDGYSNHVHALAGLGRLDFVYVDRSTADLLFGQARKVALFPGREVLVPRAEHLIAMKVLAMKNDPSRAFQELADIQHLMTTPGIDEAEVEACFQRYGLAEKYDELRRATRPA